MTNHLVQFSTGAGSSAVAFLVDELSAPADRLVLITADTLVEDADNWRFAEQVVAQLPAAEWVILTDGRTPMEVGRSERCVPNDRMAVCSKILKRELIRSHLDAHYAPADSIVYLGYDWTEEPRLDAARAPWEPWRVECPLMDRPDLDKRTILDLLRLRGIEPPRLYAAGFGHANCGGACVRGGQTEWRRLLYWNRDRFLAWESDELATQALLGKPVTILTDRRKGEEDTPTTPRRPLSLRTFRERLERDASLFDPDDRGACGCDPWAGP